ncbi:MAG: hypothetical protein EAZ07_00480 [Cytophagales bacterium]|nr:MAG: hypothetical protein EAZ07_00480 [Cytophagales bacterium]
MTIISFFFYKNKVDTIKLSFLFFLLGLWVASLFEPFFWDTSNVLENLYWFFDTKTISWIVPDNIDAGHPPFWAFLISLFWKLFGISHFSTRIVLLPILLGIGVLYINIARKYLDEKWVVWAILFFCFDTTVLSQLISLNADVPILFLSLWVFWEVIHERNALIPVLMVALTMLSVRAWFLMPVFAGVHFIYRKNWYNTFLIFLWPSIAVLLWCVYHYYFKGWVTSAPLVSEHRNLVSFGAGLRNLIICGWKFLEFGRFFLYFVLVVVLIRNPFRKIVEIAKNELFILLLFNLFVLTMLFMMFSNPIGNRYFLVPIVVGYICSMKAIQDMGQEMNIKPLLISSLLIVFSGNFWKYPKTISTGWDSTLTHLPYHSLMSDFQNYVSQSGIPASQIFTCFPMCVEEKNRILGASNIMFSVIQDTNWVESPYILYSNASNSFTEEQREEFSQNWTEVYRLSSFYIDFVLYKNPKFIMHDRREELPNVVHE